MEGAAGHRNGDIQTAGTDRDHPDSASSGGVAVAAQKGFTRNAKALQVDLVTDSVTRAGEDHTLCRRYRLKIAMIVGVFKADLNSIMINIAEGQFVLNSLQAHRFKLKIGHRPGCVLGKRLVDGYSDWISSLKRPFFEVRAENFFRQGESHSVLLTSDASYCTECTRRCIR